MWCGVSWCRSEGGDRVEALLVHEIDESKVKVTMLDNANGTYSLSFTVASEGTWNLRLKVNPLESHPLPAPYPPMDAPNTLTLPSLEPHTPISDSTSSR